MDKKYFIIIAIFFINFIGLTNIIFNIKHFFILELIILFLFLILSIIIAYNLIIIEK